MKYKIIIIIITIIIFISIIVVYKNTIGSYRYVIKINWNINITEPDDTLYIKEADPSFNGDGENYYILLYNQKSLERLKRDITFYESDSEIQNEVMKIIQKMDIPKEFYPSLDKEYVYYTKKKHDASSIYLINIDNKLYIIEQLC